MARTGKNLCLWLAMTAIGSGLWLGSARLLAQQPPDTSQQKPGPVLSKPDDAQQEKADVTVQVKVVNVPATVRDKHGKIVNTLTKDDFVLEEDGRRPSVTSHEKAISP